MARAHAHADEEGAAFRSGCSRASRPGSSARRGRRCLSQEQLEPILEAHLRTLPAARLERDTAFTGLRQDADGVTVTLGARTVRAAYVIGADGIHSAVRAAAGIGLDASGPLSDSVGAQVRAPLWPLVPRHRRHGIYATAGGALIPVGEDRWIYATERRPGVEATAPALTRLVRDAAGVADLPVQIDRVIELRYATALAHRFRRDRVFLAGDAAHRVTPRGATGLSTALIGGEAIAWRLGWVLRGWAAPELLDGYERDRRPIAEHNIARSSQVTGSERPVEDEWRVDVAAGSLTRGPRRGSRPSTSSAAVARCSPARTPMGGPPARPGCRALRCASTPSPHRRPGHSGSPGAVPS